MRWLLWLCLCGCLSDPNDGGGLRAVLAARDYRNDSFIRVNGAPFASVMHTSEMVNVYVSAAAAASYRAVTPDAAQAPAPLPEGTLLVREIVGTGGVIRSLTVMEKREPGFFSAGGDFLYAATKSDGTPLTAGDGSPEWGPLETCAGCHAARSAQGWLFGVERSAR